MHDVDINHPIFKHAMAEEAYHCNEGTVVDPSPGFLNEKAQTRWEKCDERRKRKKESKRLQELIAKHRL